MKQKFKGYTADFLKRRAKNIKKTQKITYMEALDKASILAGFIGWKNFIKESRVTINTKKSVDTSASKMPSPIEKMGFPDFNPHRKLLIAATNKLLEKELISIDTIDDPERIDDGYVFANLFGYPSVILWSDIGFQELRISVWWKYNHSLHPQAHLTGNAKENFKCASPLAKPQHYRKFVGVTASGWLERKSGKYLQGKNQRGIFEVYTRRGEITELNKLSIPIAKGFLIEGPVHF